MPIELTCCSLGSMCATPDTSMWCEALARNISTLMDCVTLVVVSHVVVHVYGLTYCTVLYMLHIVVYALMGHCTL